MSTTITRPTMTDDTGDGASGDILNAAFFNTIFDAIDAILANNLSLGGTVTAAGLITATLGLTSTARLVLTGATISLANGRNDNVAVGNVSYVHGISGPTGAYQISGIVPQGVDGQVLVITQNSSFVLTINHADTNSSAANRIYCPGSVNKALSATFGIAVLIYNSLIPGWSLVVGL